jgi:hypothetical protein
VQKQQEEVSREISFKVAGERRGRERREEGETHDISTQRFNFERGHVSEYEAGCRSERLK